MQTLRTAWWALRSAWRVSPGSLLIQLVVVLLDSAGPAVQVLLVARLVEVGAAGGGRTTPDVVATVLLAALVFGLSSALRTLSVSMSQALGKKIKSSATTELAFAMARVSPADLLDADLATEARTAREAIGQYLFVHAPYVINSLRAVLTMVLLVGAMAPYSVPAALIIALSCLPVIAAFTRVSKLEETNFPKMSKQNRFAEYYADQLVYERTGLELASLGTGHKLARLAAGRIERSTQIFVGTLYRCAAWILGAAVITALLLGLALFLLLTSPTATAGALAAGVVAVLSGMAATSDAAYTFGVVMAGTPGVQSYRTFVETRLASATEATSWARPVPVEEMRVEGVSYRYPNADRPSVQDVSFGVRRGQMVGIVGANGAGKTTLVRLVMGLLPPETGRVLLDGRPLAELGEPERLASFGALAQEFGRYELTVRDAVALGTAADDVPDEAIWRALEVARLRDHVATQPDGLDTQLGAQFEGVGLSGGQWQRLALARIALRDAPIWVLDEPTSAVDAETEREIFDDLGSGRVGRITLVVSHRATTLRSMDRILVLDDGRLVQDGTYADLLAAPGRFRQIFHEDEPTTV